MQGADPVTFIEYDRKANHYLLYLCDGIRPVSEALKTVLSSSPDEAMNREVNIGPIPNELLQHGSANSPSLTRSKKGLQLHVGDLKLGPGYSHFSPASLISSPDLQGSQLERNAYKIHLKTWDLESSKVWLQMRLSFYDLV